VTTEGRKLPPWWIFLIAIVVILILLRWWFARRRKKRIATRAEEIKAANVVETTELPPELS
jgi:uncharacterized membrane protein